MLTFTRLLRDSLRHHRRIHAAVALGVAVTTAVLVGALVVGDSVRGSLKDTALGRLGMVNEALITDKFFSVDLAKQIDNLGRGEPLILLEGSVTNPDSKTRASQVTLIGDTTNNGLLPDLRFPHDETKVEHSADIQDDEVILNQPLAEELGAKEGDEVIVRLPAAREVPEESALGRKTDAVAASPRLKIKWIVPAERYGAFSLRPNQQAPKNAYLTNATLQKIVDKPGRANALFLCKRFAMRTIPAEELAETHQRLTEVFHPTLADYGLKWTQAKPGYFSLTSERMLFEPSYEAASLVAYKNLKPQSVLTYLANSIVTGTGDGAKEIPYSTIAAIDMVAEPTLGPFKTPDGKNIDRIGDDEILLNKWAADDLGVQPGATITIKYFEPESTHADVKEATATFRLAAIVDLKEKDDPFLSAELTPELPGVTDQLTIRGKRNADGTRSSGWDPPFPYEAERIRDKDEEYWDAYRATPKAFVSAATGKKLWSSRFGEMTSLRVAPREGLTIEKLNAMFQPDPASLGFAFQPVKLQALKAATGTTPFEGLFLGFSFFIIAAAVLLTVLLFKLGVEQRANEAGLLLAVGLGSKRVGRLLLAEGALVAAIGAGLGIAVGVGYAWLMLYLLRTLWFEAVRTSALNLHVEPLTLGIGYAIGLIVSVLAIGWSLRSLKRISVRRLLGGDATDEVASIGSGVSLGTKRGIFARFIVPGCLIAAIGLGIGALQLSDMAQAGAFFGSAALVLTALVVLARRMLTAAKFGSLVTQGSGRIATLAVRNAGRNPGRSTLTIALVASAAFLIVSVSAFRLAPPDSYLQKSSGTGGFALLSRSDTPVLPDLNSENGQIDLNFSQAQRKQLAAIHTFPIRYQPGDDSSCLNLYQTTKPQVLGVTDALIERGGFAWAASAAMTPEEHANPWLILRRSAKYVSPRELPYPDDPGFVPVVLDMATAQYGLHLGGVGSQFSLDVGNGRPAVQCRIVGLLQNSILQGAIITSETHFKQRFPDTSGYRLFLTEAKPDQVESTRSTYEDVLSDFGFDAESTQTILAGYMSVQNTYLSTFQTLGGLGLLLGTFGLAVAQLRNVLERRGELALLQAVGLSKSLNARLVLGENLALLGAGLFCGVGAASIAVLPHAFAGGAGVPWLWLAGTLGAVLIAGLISAALAVRAVMRMPLLASLRGE